MAAQDQRIDGTKLENSQVQLAQAGQNAVSFQNSDENRVTINNNMLRLFGQPTPASVDWEWAQRLLNDKQLPEIRQRLKDSLLRDRALMSIALDEQLSWVGRSPLEANRHLQVQEEDRGILDMNQLLIETFGQEDIAGKLLILGTPGAGKTIALLSLAEQLVCGAIARPKTVIPVLFELSTWRNDNQSIEDWLIQQLYDLHNGDRKAKLYEHWLQQQVLLPLLDGLDELGLERQQKCTLRINEFAKTYPKLVVCCRVKEFAQVNIKLKNLKGAVCLEPLTDNQIQAYLETIQRPQLWSIIQSIPALQKMLEPTEEGDPGLLRVPLFVTLAASVDNAQRPFQTKAELLTQYVDRQLSIEVRESDRRKGLEKRDWAYTTPTQEPDWRQTQRTLGWLARQLQRNNTVELLIERIQPTWLETKQLRRRYRVIFGLTGGLIFGLIFGLNVGPIFGLNVGLNVGLMGGSMGGSIAGLSDIKPVETFKISLSQGVQREILKNLKQQLILGLMGGLSVGLMSGLIFGLSVGLSVGLMGGLIFGLTAGLIFGLILGLEQDLQLRSRPNQGIWNSLQSLLWTTVLIYPLGIVLTFGVIELPLIVAWGINQGKSGWGILNALGAAFPKFLFIGFFGALLFSFLIGGGLACVQHVCLRFVLWQSGVAPWNLARFLNYCVERRLLQRVGGRYRFLHRELLDHFATQPPRI